jgi:predicted Fe-S protein YdhL (DUF1289 family)
MSISAIRSPCIRVCTYDKDFICQGCGRTRDEITEWFYTDDARKIEIRDQSAERISNRMRRVRVYDGCTG